MHIKYYVIMIQKAKRGDFIDGCVWNGTERMHTENGYHRCGGHLYVVHNGGGDVLRRAVRQKTRILLLRCALRHRRRNGFCMCPRRNVISWGSVHVLHAHLGGSGHTVHAFRDRWRFYRFQMIRGGDLFGLGKGLPRTAFCSFCGAGCGVIKKMWTQRIIFMVFMWILLMKILWSGIITMIVWAISALSRISGGRRVYLATVLRRVGYEMAVFPPGSLING